MDDEEEGIRPARKPAPVTGITRAPRAAVAAREQASVRAPARNQPCNCGSGRKFKVCCGEGTRVQHNLAISTRQGRVDYAAKVMRQRTSRAHVHDFGLDALLVELSLPRFSIWESTLLEHRGLPEILECYERGARLARQQNQSAKAEAVLAKAHELCVQHLSPDSLITTNVLLLQSQADFHLQYSCGGPRNGQPRELFIVAYKALDVLVARDRNGSIFEPTVPEEAFNGCAVSFHDGFICFSLLLYQVIRFSPMVNKLTSKHWTLTDHDPIFLEALKRAPRLAIQASKWHYEDVACTAMIEACVKMCLENCRAAVDELGDVSLSGSLKVAELICKDFLQLDISNLFADAPGVDSVLDRGRLGAVRPQRREGERKCCRITRPCAYCGVWEPHLNQYACCGKCSTGRLRFVVYCCKEHQIADWKQHKRSCPILSRILPMDLAAIAELIDPQSIIAVLREAQGHDAGLAASCVERLQCLCSEEDNNTFKCSLAEEVSVEVLLQWLDTPNNFDLKSSIILLLCSIISSDTKQKANERAQRLIPCLQARGVFKAVASVMLDILSDKSIKRNLVLSTLAFWQFACCNDLPMSECAADADVLELLIACMAWEGGSQGLITWSAADAAHSLKPIAYQFEQCCAALCHILRGNGEVEDPRMNTLMNRAVSNGAGKVTVDDMLGLAEFEGVQIAGLKLLDLWSCGTGTDAASQMRRARLYKDGALNAVEMAVALFPASVQVLNYGMRFTLNMESVDSATQSDGQGKAHQIAKDICSTILERFGSVQRFNEALDHAGHCEETGT